MPIPMKPKPLTLAVAIATAYNGAHAMSCGDYECLPIKIENETEIAKDSSVFVTVKANVGGRDCFMEFDRSGKGECRVIDSQTNSLLYAYKLSDLPGGTLYLPRSASGRIYFSLGAPVDFLIDRDAMRIVDPDGFKPRDVNYYTLYDKIEYSFTKDGVWANPTAVDFFSLPIRLAQQGADGEMMHSGFSFARESIMNQARTMMLAEDKTLNKMWSKLFLKESQTDTILRLMSPGKAMVDNVIGADPFDPHYLNNKKAYGFDYIDYLWFYYLTNTIQIDASELKCPDPNNCNRPQLSDYLFTGQVQGEQFVFENGDKSASVTIDRPQNSIPFFAGANGPFEHQNNTPKAIIVRQLTSAFEAGLLPAPPKTLLNRVYFDKMREAGQYYQSNPIVDKVKPAQGPWYDLYSKVLHSFGSEQSIYTFAYDDALGQDGTLHDPSADSPHELTVTLGDMTGSEIPDPYTDTNNYEVELLIGDKSQVEFEGKTYLPGRAYQLHEVPVPFQVKLNGQEANIYFRYPMVTPQFREADGIVIEKINDASYRVIFPGR